MKERINKDDILIKMRSFMENHVYCHKTMHKDFLEFDWRGLKCSEETTLLTNAISSGKPLFIGRFGATELKYFLRYLAVNKQLTYPPSLFGSIFRGQPICWPITAKSGPLQTGAGVFPYNQQTLDYFGEKYLEAVKQLDILLSWQRDESYLWKEKILPYGVKQVNFRIVEKPFRCENPWTNCLEGKKILVVSPFAQLILEQVENIDKLYTKPLFKNCSIDTLMAVESLGENAKYCKYESWKDAIEAMKEDISKRVFDIAMLGCGAYAFPLAAFVKKLGKTAITTCGSTQLYFGIYGTRWEKLPERNEYWRRPDSRFRPKGSEKVENGCYW